MTKALPHGKAFYFSAYFSLVEKFASTSIIENNHYFRRAILEAFLLFPCSIHKFPFLLPSKKLSKLSGSP